MLAQARLCWYVAPMPLSVERGTEEHSMSDLVEGRPEFAAAMRGYDRVQVDEYVDRLHTLIAKTEDRARAAESQVEFGAHATVGPRVTQIFELAIAETEELRAQVQADADRLSSDAQRRADEVVAAAERVAENIVVQARSQGEDELAKIEGEREIVRRQVDALEARKSHLVDELRRLQGALGIAADSVAESHAEPPAWNEEGQTETMEQAILPPDSDAEGSDSQR